MSFTPNRKILLSNRDTKSLTLLYPLMIFVKTLPAALFLGAIVLPR